MSGLEFTKKWEPYTDAAGFFTSRRYSLQLNPATVTPELVVEALTALRDAQVFYKLGIYYDEIGAILLDEARRLDESGAFTPEQRSRYVVAAATW